MNLAARLGQVAVLLVIAALLVWQIARWAVRRRDLVLDRFRRHQEP